MKHLNLGADEIQIGRFLLESQTKHLGQLGRRSRAEKLLLIVEKLRK